jgi:hypothetical protein
MRNELGGEGTDMDMDGQGEVGRTLLIAFLGPARGHRAPVSAQGDRWQDPPTPL